MTLKKAKLSRLLLRLMFVVIGFVAPITIMLIKFNITSSEQTTKNKITIIGLFIILMIVAILWKLKARLYDWINSWEYSILKYILIGFSRVYIFILILAVALLVQKTVTNSIEQIQTGITTALDNMIFCLYTVCISQCVAYIFIYPFEQKFDYTVKRMIRKQERIEDYNEATATKE